MFFLSEILFVFGVLVLEWIVLIVSIFKVCFFGSCIGFVYVLFLFGDFICNKIGESIWMVLLIIVELIFGWVCEGYLFKILRVKWRVN